MLWLATLPGRISLKSPLSALQNNQQIEKLMSCGAWTLIIPPVMIPGWSTCTSSTYVICYLALTIAPIIAPIVNIEPKSEYCSITKRCWENHIQKCIRQAKDSLRSNATKWILHKTTRYNISLHFETSNNDFSMKIRSVSPSHIVLTAN